MTYIDYLNDFNQWLETNTLPASSQLMYYKLLHVFNRAGWPEHVGVDNLRLRQMMGNTAEKTAIQARDKLVEAGFITYQKGRKGLPNRYALSNKHCKIYSINDSVSVSENDSKKVSVSVSENASHIKTKKKTKTKTFSPIGENTPARRARGEYGWVKLTDEEYHRLEAKMGADELRRCITYIDESAQSSGNKNRWKDWNLVLRRCHREGWGVSTSGKASAKSTALGADFQPSTERIQKNADWLDSFLAEQKGRG